MQLFTHACNQHVHSFAIDVIAVEEVVTMLLLIQNSSRQKPREIDSRITSSSSVAISLQLWPSVKTNHCNPMQRMYIKWIRAKSVLRGSHWLFHHGGLITLTEAPAHISKRCVLLLTTLIIIQCSRGDNTSACWPTQPTTAAYSFAKHYNSTGLSPDSC